MLRVGVLGAGHLGKIHIKCLQNSDKYELIGFYDNFMENALLVEKEYNVKSFESIDELLKNVDVVDIVTPTITHFECASKALKMGKHVFIEKPIVATPDEAKALISIAEEANRNVQVGHVERFNPAFVSVKDRIVSPVFIEAHRLSMFNPRGNDVPVVLDLMIHDIDVILSIVKSEIRNIYANGVSIVNSTPDIANVRIEFKNGAIANLTASRFSMKNMRKMRIFQRDAYISVDFLTKESEVITIKDANPETAGMFDMLIDTKEGTKRIKVDKPEIVQINAIQTELGCFADSIVNNTKPAVSIYDGCKALEVAHEIVKKIGDIKYSN